MDKRKINYISGILLKKGEGAKAPCIMSNKETFLDLVGKRDFMEKIVEMQDESEVIKAFEKEGVTPTKEDMGLLKNILNKTCDELGKHSKEEIKKIKETLDNLTDRELLAVAGGNNTKEILGECWDFVKGATQATLDAKTGQNKLEEIKDNNRTTRHGQEVDLEKSRNKSKVAMVGIGAAGALMTLYMFRDEIKGWFRK